MHKGEWIGSEAQNQRPRILILGESHRWSAEDWKLLEGETEDQAAQRRAKKAADYTTEEIVNNYLETYQIREDRDNAYRFFEKIILSFGLDPEQNREDFFGKVYFGNYIDILCGIKDGVAEEYISAKPNGRPNRVLLNDQLFEFVNENDIDIVLCFSRLAFNSLPSLNKKMKKEEDKGRIKTDITVGGRNDYIGKCIYLPNIDHANTTVTLKKPLEVYSLRHPSASGGYKPENYVSVLKDILF